LTKVTSPTREYKARTRLVRWLRKQTAAAGQRLFARDDLNAAQHGWQIITRYGGLGRQYRDPRFDTLRECPPCAGSGAGSGVAGDEACAPCAAGGEACAPCAATGRITVPARPPPPPGG
jgi:hypothetical protein